LKLKHFTIENETNNIMVHTSVAEADAVPNSRRFGTEAALGKLAADWPTARLVDVWNSLPGVTPVGKFKDRSTAVIEDLEGPSEPRGAGAAARTGRAPKRVG
jgi:hypothetical protein